MSGEGNSRKRGTACAKALRWERSHSPRNKRGSVAKVGLEVIESGRWRQHG